MCFKIYYSNELYKNVIKKNSARAVSLDIISGYASPNIIKQVLTDYSHLTINLYIGMALEGISLNDHKSFVELMDDFPQLNVFYKIKYPLTHIKLYQFEFSDKEFIKYVGSANFSKAGFNYNQEILLESIEDFSELFEGIDEASMLCTNEEIERFILFYNDKNDDIITNSQEKPNEVVEEIPHETYRTPKQLSNNNTWIRYRNLKIRRFSSLADADFRIPIIIKKDIFQEDKGINAWVRNEIPYLRQSNKFPFTDYFPLENEFKIVTDAKETFTGKLIQGKPTQMELYPNIYEYLKKKLALHEHRPIEYEDLLKNNLLEIWGAKISNDSYYFDFSPKNADKRRY